MSDETDLYKAIAYLHDLDAELEERSAVCGLRANSAACEDMLYQLDHATTSCVLMNLVEDNPKAQARNAALMQELQRLG